MCIYFKLGPLVQGRYHLKIFPFLAQREKTTWVDPENSVSFFFVSMHFTEGPTNLP